MNFMTKIESEYDSYIFQKSLNMLSYEQFFNFPQSILIK